MFYALALRFKRGQSLDKKGQYCKKNANFFFWYHGLSKFYEIISRMGFRNGFYVYIFDISVQNSVNIWMKVFHECKTGGGRFFFIINSARGVCCTFTHYHKIIMSPLYHHHVSDRWFHIKNTGCTVTPRSNCGRIQTGILPLPKYT